MHILTRFQLLYNEFREVAVWVSIPKTIVIGQIFSAQTGINEAGCHRKIILYLAVWAGNSSLLPIHQSQINDC